MHNLEWALTVNTECCIRITFCFSNGRCPHQLAHDGQSCSWRPSDQVTCPLEEPKAPTWASLFTVSAFESLPPSPHVSVLPLLQPCWTHLGVSVKVLWTFPNWNRLLGVRPSSPLTSAYVTTGCVKTFPATALLMGESSPFCCLQSLVSWSCLQSPNTSCPTLSSSFPLAPIPSSILHKSWTLPWTGNLPWSYLVCP